MRRTTEEQKIHGKAIGKAITTIISIRDSPAKEIARAMGVTASSIYAYKTAINKIPVCNLITLLKCLNITPFDFFMFVEMAYTDADREKLGIQKYNQTHTDELQQ